MPVIAVSPLSMIAEVAVRLKAREMISLLAENQPFHRPGVIDPDRHLNLAVNDITIAQAGLTEPRQIHVRRIIDFARTWDQSAPLLIHCWYGVSRSPAAALIAALSVRPELDETALVATLRSASPQASPNAALIEIADQMLERNGRLAAAVTAAGRGADYAGDRPFSFSFGDGDDGA